MNTVTTTASIEAKSTQPIYIWGAIGFFFLLLEIYVFGSWIMSSDFKPTDPGISEMPGYVAFAVTFFQAFNVVLAIFVVAWAIRTCRREGRLTTPMILILAWLLTLWQDPLANNFRLFYTYNSHFVNFGSWANFIPGWVMPNGNLIPEPVIFIVFCYAGMLPLLGFFSAWLMRKTKARWPGIGKLGLIGVACGAMAIMDLIIEGLWVRTGCYAFSGTISSLSFFGGEWYQFPIYNVFIWGPVLALGGILMYFRDDKGHIVIEKGCETISSPVKRDFLRIMALSGVLNIAFLFYNVSMQAITFHVDTTPELPSYLTNGICGPGTGYTCPGPDVHVPLPDSGYLVPIE